MMEYKYNGELYKEFTKDEAYEWGILQPLADQFAGPRKYAKDSC